MTGSAGPPADRRPARQPGDGWVECRCGARHWGRNGAAGLLAWRLADGRVEVALQHRAAWSHHGGTWGVPGGAIADGETAVEGGLREAAEESGLAAGQLRLHSARVLDHPDWSYTTLVARADDDAVVRATDAESLEVRWAGLDELTTGTLPLLPAFADSLDELTAMLGRVVLVVDSANVVGSVPDGWWRDRARATERLRDSLAGLVVAGLDAADVGLPGSRWFPEIHLVAEGAARGVGSSAAVTVHDAPGEGDDAIVALAGDLVGELAGSVTAAGSDVEGATGSGRGALAPGFVRVVVATADRALAARCEALGAVVVGPRTVRPSS